MEICSISELRHVKSNRQHENSIQEAAESPRQLLRKKICSSVHARPRHLCSNPDSSEIGEGEVARDVEATVSESRSIK